MRHHVASRCRIGPLGKWRSVLSATLTSPAAQPLNRSTAQLLLFPLAALLLLTAIGLAQAGEDEFDEIPLTPLPGRLAGLDRMKPEERTLLLHEVAWERQRVFTALIRRLDSSSAEARVHAAFLLGHWHLEQAAPHLARKLTLRDDKAAERPPVWFWGEYPAQEALVRLGSAAIPSVIEVLATSDDATSRRLALLVVRSVDGTLAQARLSQARDDEGDRDRRRRLERALAELSAAP